MQEQTNKGKVITRYLEEEMQDSYLSYSMSVIAGRALPDIRDGLKPVQRRIMYAMHELHLRHNQPHKKCARIVGETLGKFHPHGDLSVYDALVRMAQDFSLRYPLVNGQGNFGCFTKDTKVKLADGRCLNFGELVEEDRHGKKNYTFTFNSVNKRVEIAQVRRPRLTIKNAKLLKITLDNNEEIKCTLNHKFMLRDGFYKEAKYLQPGESLMPLYARLSEANDDVNVVGYEMIYQPFLNEWDWAHYLADDWNVRNNVYQKSNGKLRHHIDFNKLNNNPGNIIRLPWEKHWQIHYEETSNRHKNDPGYRLKIAAGRRRFWADENNKKAYSLRMAARNIKMWENKKYRDTKIAAIKQLWRNEEYKQARRITSRENLKALWMRGDFKNKISALKSKELKRRWQDEKYVEQMREAARKMSTILWSNPLHREHISKCQKQKWLNGAYRAKISAQAKRQWENPEYKKFMADCYREKWANSAEFRNKFMPILTENGRKAHFYRFLKVCNQAMEIYGKLTPLIYEKVRREYGSRKGEGIVKYEKAVNKYFNGDELKLKTILAREEEKIVNHKVTKIELLQETQDVYDLTINCTHNFALGAGVFVHNSIDGDPPAAMRYSEARLSRIADYILQDIEKETVKFFPNFDNSLTEPEVLPSIVPNLLINGASGIAVGMATNMPPHNLGEVCDALEQLIDNPTASIKELHKFIKGPDFPTGAIICGKADILKMYEEGKGRLILRAKSTIEHEKGKSQIIFTEIPYQLNKTNLIEAMAALVTDKKIEGVSDLRDESNKEGIRIVLELKRDVEPQIILNQLYKHTNLETTFGAIFLALVNRKPVILNLKEMLAHHINFRKEVIVKRTKFELDKAQKRAHILEGLKIALKHLDEVVALIKKSKNPQEAKEGLMKKFSLSDLQAQAILEMQLVRLCALERNKIDEEYMELLKKIELYNLILSSEKKQEELIKQELKDLREQFADNRRTEIVAQKEEIEIEDLIVEEDMIVTISGSGYIKRMPLTAYRQQKRGGRGVAAMTTSEEDFVEHLFVASSKDTLLVFTDEGKIYPIKTYEVPLGSRTSKGRAIINLLSLTTKEKITKVLSTKEFEPKQFILMATEGGIIKRTSLELFANIRKSGICAITLDKDDRLVGAGICEDKDEVILITKKGKSIRFEAKDIRPTGRQSQGVRGMKLGKGDVVVGMVLLEGTLKKEDFYILTATENGFAKRSHIEEYRLQSRGGKGIINIKVSPKIGDAKGAILVQDSDEVMCITQKGILIRTKIKDIRSSGRSTQGVKIINLESGDKLSTIARIVPEE